MTTKVGQLTDGRLSIMSFDELAIPEVIDLFRRFHVQHLVWLVPLDHELMAFASNFGVTFQVGDGPGGGHLVPEKILVVG